MLLPGTSANGAPLRGRWPKWPGCGQRDLQPPPAPAAAPAHPATAAAPQAPAPSTSARSASAPTAASCHATRPAFTFSQRVQPGCSRSRLERTGSYRRAQIKASRPRGPRSMVSPGRRLSCRCQRGAPPPGCNRWRSRGTTWPPWARPRPQPGPCRSPSCPSTAAPPGGRCPSAHRGRARPSPRWPPARAACRLGPVQRARAAGRHGVDVGHGGELDAIARRRGRSRGLADHRAGPVRLRRDRNRLHRHRAGASGSLPCRFPAVRAH